MPAQPNVFKGNDGKVSRYNLRKFAELPFHLIGSARTVDLCDHVLFNYYWLHAKISAVPILNILEDFTRALSLIHDPPLRRQVWKSLGTFPHCLKITQNVSFANFSILAFFHQFLSPFKIDLSGNTFGNSSKCPFLAFTIIFCLIKIDLSGNTVWPQASVFQKLAKTDLLWNAKNGPFK